MLSNCLAQKPSGSYFTAATLQRGIESYLREQLGPDDKITILSPLTDIHFEEPMVVAHCRTVGRIAGRTEVELTFVIGTRTLRSIRVPVKISAYRMVPIAKHALERGTLLTQEDITFERRDISQQLGIVSDSIVGKRLAQSVMPGTVLVNSLLLGSGSVRNGEEVTLLIRSGTITIRTRARALQNADTGNQLKVRRDDTGAVLVGILTDGKTVVTELGRTQSLVPISEVP